MSFFSRALTRASPEPVEVRVADFSSIPAPGVEAMYDNSGRVNEGDPKTLAPFYACTTLLADTIASLSIKAYREQDDARLVVDPQPSFLANSPYPGMTWFDWLWQMCEALTVTGNAFGFITARDKELRPTSIRPIHPNNVEIRFIKDDNNLVDFLNPIYHVRGKRVKTKDIVHIKRFPIADSALGMSPVEKMGNTISLGLSAEKYGYRWFRDSASPSGLLSTDQELTTEQVMRTQMQWYQANKGRRLPAVMHGGMTWQPVSISPNESQFLETRSFSKSDMEMFFRVPPHMISDTEKSTSYGTGIEHQSIGFVTYTLKPWLTCIEQLITTLIPRSQFAKFNIDGLLRGDVKTRWEAYELGRNSGVYSVNDIRAMEDLPPVEDGDGRIQPLNFVKLGYIPPPEPKVPVKRIIPPDDGEKEV